jgi:hypothetical protein
MRRRGGLEGELIADITGRTGQLSRYRRHVPDNVDRVDGRLLVGRRHCIGDSEEGFRSAEVPDVRLGVLGDDEIAVGCGFPNDPLGFGLVRDLQPVRTAAQDKVTDWVVFDGRRL